MIPQYRRNAMIFALGALGFSAVLILDRGEYHSADYDAEKWDSSTKRRGVHTTAVGETDFMTADHELDSMALSTWQGDHSAGNTDETYSLPSTIASQRRTVLPDSLSRDRAGAPISASSNARETDPLAVVSDMAARGDYSGAADIVLRSTQGKAFSDASGLERDMLRDSIAEGFARYLSRTATRDVDAETKRLMEDSRVRSLMGSMDMKEHDMERLIDEFLTRRVTSGDIRPKNPTPIRIEPRSYEPVSAEPIGY